MGNDNSYDVWRDRLLLGRHEKNTTATRLGCKAKDLQIDIADGKNKESLRGGHKKAPASSDTGARRMRPPEGRTPSGGQASGLRGGGQGAMLPLLTKSVDVKYHICHLGTSSL